jgi:outer membrane receptor protein involved in Fe transport
VIGGSWRRRAARHASIGILSAGLVIGLPAAVSAQRLVLSIPATTLDDAITRLGAAARVDVVSTEPGLGRLRSRPVAGQLTASEALAALLQGTGYRAVAIDARSFRIVRAPLVATPPARAQPVATAPTLAQPVEDVIVTASKQRVPLLRYPGSITSIVTASTAVAEPARDLSRTARVTPVLQTTEYGPGRNKIFIRGIADSSFNGAAQSTASVYLGDVQLGYSGADPSLRLYDMASVQVMEGPQGTLYGSGSIGGIIRLEPVAPALDRVAGEVSGGVTLTRGGSAGGDVGAVVNLPVIADTVGIRAVTYRVHDGGYLDDLGSLAGVAPRRDVNTIDTVGGRLAARIVPGGGWGVDLTGVYQRIDAADAQYADRGVGPLARRTAFAQPFDNELALGSATVTKDWDSGVQLLAVAGLASTHGHDRFDATALRLPGPGTPAAIYLTDEAKRLITAEARLSRSLAGGRSWIVGISALAARDAQNRAFGTVAMPADIIGVTNVTRSASVFAEVTEPLWPAFLLTLGGRVTVARTDGEPSFRPRVADFVQGRSTRRFDPTVAFAWRLAPTLTAFGRAQSGYRTGGLAVARGIGRVADFQSDSIRMGEVGLRWLRRGETGLSATSAFSIARWTSIQADIINRRGLPYTDNIGDAEIEAFEGTLDWVPVRGVSAVVNFLQTYNRTRGEVAASSTPAHRRLPETPPFALSGELGYGWRVGSDDRLKLAGTLVRVGRSVLGTGDLLDIDQGKYMAIGGSIRWQRGRYELSLVGENLSNSHGNLFAQGNPFDIALRDLTTPLRPANVRLGARVSW